jgi:antitoxin MazE
VKTTLIRIGNSQGVRIPKSVIEQCGLEREVEMSVRGDTILIAPARPPRAGWDDAFKRMRKAGDDALATDDALPNAFDREEWSW